MATAAQLEMPVPPEREQFSSEFELLLACCHQNSDNHRLTLALKSSIHWDVVLRLSEHHRILPALQAAVYGREDVPASIQSALRSRFQSNALKALRFSAELVRITQAFAEIGIEVLAHKGPALAQLLYGDPTSRQYGDLDLLVQPADVARARDVLQQLGYSPQLQLSLRQERAYLQSGYEYVFALGDQRNLLELQWRILPRFYSIEFDLKAMFPRSVEVTIEGFCVRGLGPEDLMLVLCAHAAKHGWGQLGMLRDIATLAGFKLDWDWVFREARRIGVLRIVAISLLLARNLLGSLFPDIADTGEVHAAGKMAHTIQTGLADGECPDTSSAQYFRDFARLRERWQDRMRMGSRLVLTPSVGEWERVRMPDSMFGLYQMVRIGRLVKRAVYGGVSKIVS
jgi:hypothetical protein